MVMGLGFLSIAAILLSTQPARANSQYAGFWEGKLTCKNKIGERFTRDLQLQIDDNNQVAFTGIGDVQKALVHLKTGFSIESGPLTEAGDVYLSGVFRDAGARKDWVLMGAYDPETVTLEGRGGKKKCVAKLKAKEGTIKVVKKEYNYDFSGYWAGSIKCQDSIGERFTRDITMAIDHDYNVLFDGFGETGKTKIHLEDLLYSLENGPLTKVGDLYLSGDHDITGTTDDWVLLGKWGKQEITLKGKSGKKKVCSASLARTGDMEGQKTQVASADPVVPAPTPSSDSTVQAPTSGGLSYCLPSNVSVADVSLAISDYFLMHPETGFVASGDLVEASLANIYPCN